MSATSDNSTATGNAATDTTAGTTKTKAAKAAPKQGLTADAAAAKALYGAQDERQANQHKDMRDNEKLVEQAPIRGYEAVRENMYKPADERVDTPHEPLEGGEPTDKDPQ